MLERTMYWSTEAMPHRLRAFDRAHYLAELKEEALVELEAGFAKSPVHGYRGTIDYDSFTYRIVTEYSDGHIVDMEFNNLGPRQRVPLTDTYGMTLREAGLAVQKDVRAQMNFLVNNAGKEIKDPAYPKRLLYQCTLTQHHQKLPEPFNPGPARFYPIGEKSMIDFNSG